MLAPLDPAHTITLRDVCAAAARIPGQLIAPGTVRSALFDIEHALTAQVNAHKALDSLLEARVQLRGQAPAMPTPVDVRPFLPGTPSAAYTRARTLGHERPDNARRRVERVLKALAPWALAATPRDVIATETLTEFHALASRVGGLEATSKKEQRRLKQVANGLRRFGRQGAAHGLVTVASLPHCVATMRERLRGWDLSAQDRNEATWVLRSARRLLPNDALAQTIPVWREDTVGDQQQQTIESRLPKLAEDLAAWTQLASIKVGTRASGNRSRTAHGPLTQQSQYAYRAGFRQWCAALITLVDRGCLLPSIPLDQLEMESLWLTTALGGVPSTMPDQLLSLLDQRRARKGMPALNATTRAERPLALAVIDLALEHGLWTKVSTGNGTVWPKSAAQMAFRLWGMTERVALGTHGEDAHVMVAMRQAWTAVMPSLKDVLLQKEGVKDVERMISIATLPQIVCLVLPWWTQVELPRLDAEAARRQREAARPHASAAAQQRMRDAHATFLSALTNYVALATFVAEPSRITNVMNARVGREVFLSAEWSSTGDLVRLTRIASAFPDREEADIAAVTPKTGEARPTWTWSPSIIDLRWFGRYLREVWGPAVRGLEARAADTPLRSLVEEKRFAFFVNTDPRAVTPHIVAGAFRDESSLATRFGDALLQGLREIGRTDLPTSVETAAAEGFAYVLRPHAVRLWWATYWFGIRGAHGPSRTLPDGKISVTTGLDVARRATCDTEGTLRGHYVQVSAVMEERMRAPLTSMEHPNAYDHLMDRTWWHDETTNWLKVWRDPRTVLPERLRQAVQADAGAITAVPSSRRRTRSGPVASLP